MKKALYGVILSALLASGCIDRLPFVTPEDDAPPAPPVKKQVAPVQASQITAGNAYEKAQQIKEEMENEREPQK